MRFSLSRLMVVILFFVGPFGSTLGVRAEGLQVAEVEARQRQQEINDEVDRLVGGHGCILQNLGMGDTSFFSTASTVGQCEFTIAKTNPTDKEPQLVVVGLQKLKNGNLMMLSGTIPRNLITKESFEFEGQIVTKVNTINEGDSCQSQGRFLFRKARAPSKYWQFSQANPCTTSGEATDTIIIWFR